MTDAATAILNHGEAILGFETMRAVVLAATGLLKVKRSMWLLRCQLLDMQLVQSEFGESASLDVDESWHVAHGERLRKLVELDGRMEVVDVWK